jgi:arylsulfatase A-like enzyme
MSAFKLIWSVSTYFYWSHHFDKTLPRGATLITWGRTTNGYDEICALLGYYTAWIGKSTFRDNLSAPSSRAKKSGCPEKSLRNYHSTLRDVQEERRYYFHREGSLKWRRADEANSWIAPKKVSEHPEPSASYVAPFRTVYMEDAYRNVSKSYKTSMAGLWLSAFA